MIVFNKDCMQEYIDELIAYGLASDFRPSWIGCDDFLSCLLGELAPFITDEIYPLDISEELRELSSMQEECSDDDIIKEVRTIIENDSYQDYVDVVIILELENSDGEKYYTSILISPDSNSNCGGMLIRDCHIISNKNFSILKNEIIQKVRPMTTKSKGGALSDSEVLALCRNILN